MYLLMIDHQNASLYKTLIVIFAYDLVPHSENVAMVGVKGCKQRITVLGSDVGKHSG